MSAGAARRTAGAASAIGAAVCLLQAVREVHLVRARVLHLELLADDDAGHRLLVVVELQGDGLPPLVLV
ncbi:hypothetical protein, partial [Microbacterium barkeri]|uniref:hypothetical protein n=1 Tax=Microbacterium barkeri TaxID=33917 RepID=UPI003F18EE3B